MTQPAILLVEDDPFQRKASEFFLRNSSFDVRAVENGPQMRRQVARAMPDLVLLDVDLPGGDDGFVLARWLRLQSTRVGIIMVSSADAAPDKVMGLDSGADDYVAKPYEPSELLARCNSVLRRALHKATPARLEKVRMGRHVLDLQRRQLEDGAGHPVALTAAEFDLLRSFAENPNRPLTRDWLMERTSHRGRGPLDRTIDLRITRLRRKLEPVPERPEVIRTVRGIGYMFAPPAD